MPIIITLVLGGAALVLYLGLALRQSWERAEVAYTLREAYQEGRKKLILGSW